MDFKKKKKLTTFYAMNLNITDVVRNLLIINIIVYFGGTYLLPEAVANHWLAVHYPTSSFFQPVQLITYMFMHANGMHLFFNMLGLYMFGPPIEYNWGPKRFLFYYLVAGFGALVLHFAVEYYQINFLGYPSEIGDIPMVILIKYLRLLRRPAPFAERQHSPDQRTPLKHDCQHISDANRIIRAIACPFIDFHMPAAGELRGN